MKVQSFLRTLRANFLPASIIPFFTGAALAYREGAHIDPFRLLLGLAGVVSAHLAGNLFNDFFDHRSGADTINNGRSPFFGGSGVIQEGLVKEHTILLLAAAFLFGSFICGIGIFFITKDLVFLVFMAVAGVLIFGYSAPPFRLAYRRAGETDIFLLFGVLLVMGSYYLFRGKFSMDSFLMSLPVSFLIGAVIICNEIPDLKTDIKAGKYNLVAFFGQKNGYKLYGLFAGVSYIAILLNIMRGNVAFFTAGLIVFYIAGFKAAVLLKRALGSREEFTRASALSVFLHFAVGTGMIAGVLVK
jgi:1,4-dihydroxy-2-naphthoate polyprenyltransferase